MYLCLCSSFFFSSRYVANLSTECTTCWGTCISMLAVSPSSVLIAPVSSTWRGTSAGIWRSSTAWTSHQKGKVRLSTHIYYLFHVAWPSDHKAGTGLDPFQSFEIKIRMLMGGKKRKKKIASGHPESVNLTSVWARMCRCCSQTWCKESIL